MRKIQSKITLTYVLLTFLVVAAVGILSSAQMESYFKDRTVNMLSNRADVMMYMLRQDSMLADEQLDERIKELARLADLRITLIAEDGVVLVDSDVPRQELPAVENHLHRLEVQQALQRGLGTATRHSATVGKDFLYMAKTVIPVGEGSSLLQRALFIRLSVHLEEIQQTVAQIRTNIFVAGGVVLLIVLGVSVLVSRRISKPMVAIARGVEEIRTGNLDHHIDVQAKDEIGRVARAVNEMVDKLKADIVQLKKLERVRSEFLGNVSHELRTPIFSLQGYLETLIEGAVDDPSVNRQFLEKAYAHASRLNTLLGDLITISQIESGEMKMSFRYFRLLEFLGGIVNDYQATASHSSISLVLTPGHDVEVLGDKERLRVVFDNLLENAIKYNRSGGTVTVSYMHEDGTVRVRVADTGVGIPPEHIPRILERFYRVDRNRSREVGGTGLGLAIVKHILEAHGTIVAVESEVGVGSTFSFTLKT